MTQEQADDPFTLFVIDQASAVPPYRQVHDAVVAAIADGLLLPGQKLPTVRGLAARLGLAVNTVASAYRSLEEAGIAEGRGRAGTRVRLGGDPVEAEARRIVLEAAAALKELGIAEDRAARLMAEAYAAQDS